MIYVRLVLEEVLIRIYRLYYVERLRNLNEIWRVMGSFVVVSFIKLNFYIEMRCICIFEVISCNNLILIIV